MNGSTVAALPGRPHRKGLLLSAILVLAVAGAQAAAASAHCFCKLGPLSSPIQNFGEIAQYGTQIGHDADCRSRCDGRASQYMAGNQTAACTASHGAPIVAFSAVGTKSYQGSRTFTCPQSNSGPIPGRVVFGTIPATIRTLSVNGTGVDLRLSQQSVTVQNQGPYTLFELDDHLSFHVQGWTYNAKLYRDNVLVEELAQKSPPAFVGGVLVDFTGQPNNLVHGHDWRVEWHYFGSGFTDGSVTFHVQ